MQSLLTCLAVDRSVKQIMLLADPFANRAFFIGAGSDVHEVLLGAEVAIAKADPIEMIIESRRDHKFN
jgi:hypothetical protein